MPTHRHVFLNHLAQTSTSPPMYEFKKAKGIYLYDKNEKPYIDMISGISVSSLGHSNKKVIKAVQKQASESMHQMVFGEYIISAQTKLAKELTKHLPGALQSIYLLNSGSEANEGALKLAKRYTRRSKIVAFKNAYHGSSHGALSLMSDQYYSGKYQPLLPNVSFAEFNKIGSLDVIDEKTACVIIEPVQAEAGILKANKNFMKALRKKCTEKGALLIFDEIQTGMGRTGSLFAFEQYGIVPDILTLGKAFGAGMPLSAFISSKKIMQSLGSKPILGHITTFGGHPVCCAASLAGLKYLIKKNYTDQVKLKSNMIVKLLKNNKKIKAIRASGLLIGLELKNNEVLMQAIDRCFEKGLITDWFLYNNKTMRLAPPLTISAKQIQKACKIINESL